MWSELWVKKKLCYTKRNSEKTKKTEHVCSGWCSPYVRCFGSLKMMARDLLVEILCFIAGNCKGFWGRVQNSSSFKYIASSTNTDLATVSSCIDCTSICIDCTSICLPWRQVAETVWVDKMTYYHCKSLYFIMWWPACGSGSQLDRKLCSLWKFVRFPLDVVANSTYLASPLNILDLFVGRHISMAMKKDIFRCHLHHLIHLPDLFWCIL